MKYPADRQMVTEQLAKMEKPVDSCHATMHIFGLLVIIGLAMQIILQFKTLKLLQKANKKR